jgi:hypothetical protein
MLDRTKKSVECGSFRDKGSFHAGFIGAGSALLREALGELDQDAPIGRITDLSECDDEPQSFDRVQVDLIVAQQLQQFVTGVIGIVDVHRKRSGRPSKWRVVKMTSMNWLT